MERGSGRTLAWTPPHPTRPISVAAPETCDTQKRKTILTAIFHTKNCQTKNL